MKPSIIKSKDELPMFMSVMDLIDLLGISRSSAYELAAEEGFPKLKLVPGRVIIPRDTLFEWLDEQTNFEMVRKEVR
jgi:predicted DNA-binding transcriptional regulator AlpA